MSIGVRRKTVFALTCAALVTASPLAAEPVALRGYNAAIGESSISGISSGAFMAIQFATAWSSLIRGVGVIAGGPYWCAKADADDFINGFTLPNNPSQMEKSRCQAFPVFCPAALVFTSQIAFRMFPI
jgi:poly(3-hydroxybutyrate) depolymerase